MGNPSLQVQSFQKRDAGEDVEETSIMASVVFERPVKRVTPPHEGNDAMKLLCGGAAMMVVMAGIVVEREANPLSPLSVFFLSGIGGTFTALATYLLTGQKNDSKSLAAHMLGNVSIAVTLGAMAAMHGAPRLTGIPADDVFQIVFVGGITGISGMTAIGALRGMLTAKVMQQIIASMCGLEVPAPKSRKKPSPLDDDDTK